MHAVSPHHLYLPHFFYLIATCQTHLKPKTDLRATVSKVEPEGVDFASEDVVVSFCMRSMKTILKEADESPSSDFIPEYN